MQDHACKSALFEHDLPAGAPPSPVEVHSRWDTARAYIRSVWQVPQALPSRSFALLAQLTSSLTPFSFASSALSSCRQASVQAGRQVGIWTGWQGSECGDTQTGSQPRWQPGTQPAVCVSCADNL